MDGDFPVGPEIRNSPASAEDARDKGLIPGLGRSSGGGHGNPLQYSCLESSMDIEHGGLRPMELQRVSYN